MDRTGCRDSNNRRADRIRAAAVGYCGAGFHARCPRHANRCGRHSHATLDRANDRLVKKIGSKSIYPVPTRLSVTPPAQEFVLAEKHVDNPVLGTILMLSALK